MFLKEKAIQSACALIHPLQLFSSSSSCTFQVKATANKWLKVQVKYVSFLSLLSQPLLKPWVVLRAGTGVRCKVKGGEDYSRYTSDKSVSLIIVSDPSCGRLRVWSGVVIGGKRNGLHLCVIMKMNL